LKDEVISLSSLKKTYGSIKALDSISLRIRKGIFGFLGPNGAGKTTTIKILLGLIKPTEGSATVLGYDCVRHSLEIRSRVGYLSEDPRFYEYMSGKAFLKFVAKLRGIPKKTAEKEADELLKRVGLAKDGKRKIKEYSQGMKQRLGMAQALIGNPQMLILDEPTSNLDPLGREELLNIIKEVGDSGASVFLSSHVLSEVERVCDHLALLVKGKVVLEGPLNDVKHRFSSAHYKVKTNDVHQLQLLLKDKPFIKEVWQEDSNKDLVVVPSNPADFRKELPKLIAQAGLELHHMEEIIPSLQEIFVSVVKRED
jgi:ABC-2 type transport system ATP-binding protein